MRHGIFFGTVINNTRTTASPLLFPDFPFKLALIFVFFVILFHDVDDVVVHHSLGIIAGCIN